MNPDDFVITRKRKKYKFAKFFNAPNCFEFEQWTKQSVDVVEIGAGTGLFSVELATLYPEKVYLALDVKADRLQKGAYVALERGLKNIIFVRARADQITDIVEPKSLSGIFVTFPDPYPRKRSAGRRLTHPNFLRKYAGLLRETGTLKLKHDNLDFFTWSLEQLVAEKWRITELSFDLHDSELMTDAKILTTYEQRWLNEGRKTNYLAAQSGESII
jgi:Predicted S-adenosylmethionine-dependent methyltransferase